MKNIVQEFDFKQEVVPVLVVGILLNLLGRYFCRKFEVPFVFVDMVGTVFASILLGPWWGAIVGITGNALNGNFHSSFFPFGIVNIAGALSIGYLVRASNLRPMLSGCVKVGFRSLLNLYILLALVGGMVCGIASTLVKLALIPPSFSRYFIPVNSPIYAAITTEVSGVMGDILSLFTRDIFRDMIDKSMVVGLAVLLALAFGSSRDLLTPPKKVPLFQRLRTDSLSIFLFILTYAFYILLARVNHPILTFSRGTPIHINWLESSRVIVMLYVPVIVALGMYLMFSLVYHKSYGREVERQRWIRRGLYKRLTLFHGNDAHWPLLKIFKGKNLYGLFGTILMWPFRRKLTLTSTLTLYFAAMIGFATAYFYQVNTVRHRLLSGLRRLDDVGQWVKISDSPSHAFPIFELMRELFDKDLVQGSPRVSVVGKVSYMAYVNIAQEGYLSQVRQDEGGESLLFAVVDAPHILSKGVMKDIDSIVGETGLRQAFILTLSVASKEPHIRKWIRRCQKRGIQLHLVSWYDLESAVEHHMSDAPVALSFAKSRAHAIEIVSTSDEEFSGRPLGYDELLRRGLPALRHIIERLPNRSMVVDVGAGRGRHTLYALDQGHHVLAIENHPETFFELKSISDTQNWHFNLKLVEDDYLNIDPATTYANLVVATGVLQHAKDIDALRHQLDHIKQMAGEPGAQVFIEMLFDMTWDKKPVKNRVHITIPQFEALLHEVFGWDSWQVGQVAGPIKRVQLFKKNAYRSFISRSAHVEVTSAEYLITGK